jgi:hypothetical protein
LAGRSHPADGSALTPVDIGDGVGCALCHRLVDPLPTGGELASRDIQVRGALTSTVPSDYVGSATVIVDPADNRRGPFAFSPPLPYHTAYRTDFIGQASEAITRARLCGTCHNVDNPLLSWDDVRGQFWLNAEDAPPDLTTELLFPIESTYREWAHSAYPQGVHAPRFAGAAPDGIVSACQDCHMERQVGTAADAPFNPMPRDCEPSGTGCLPDHLMMGGNTWMPELLQDSAWRLNAVQDAVHLNAAAARARSMLRRAASLTVTLATQGAGKQAVVRVTNETGHKLPTGYPEGRQMWLEVRAYDAAGHQVYASGLIDPSTHRLVRDPDIKVYEAKQGLTPEWAAFVNKPAGESFHFLLNNTVTKDNRIPPRGYLRSVWDRPGLRPVGADYGDGQYWDQTVYALPASTARVTARLWYQTASAEYIAFLRATGGVDGEALYDLWTRNPSPPVLMASSADPPYTLWLPIVLRTQ